MNNKLTRRKNILIGIEGIVIIGIVAFVLIIAFFGTTIISMVTSFFASITAMVAGIATGTTTLLTAWIGWSTANYTFTNIAGSFWLVFWIALFLFAGFKIATKDKPKWTNAWGKGSNYLGAFLILFLVAQPLIVSAGVTYLANSTAYTEIDFNVTDVMTQAPSSNGLLYGQGFNGTWYSDSVALTFDNATKEYIGASVALPTVNSVTKNQFYTYYNASVFAEHAISKITFTWFYVGTGNITDLQFKSVSPSPAKTFYDCPTTTSLGTNGTITYLPEVFEANQLKTKTQWGLWVMFEDSANLPTATDYLSVAIKYYTTSTVMDTDTMMFWIGVAIGVINLIGFLYLTNIYKYFM